MAEGIQIKNLPSTTAIKQGDTMTIVQDKQNKQLALDVFANESDLATLSPLENRCDEVKAKIEVDEYSAEITTSQLMSEIGSDDNGANLHENVLDGAYESCVLKGKTKYIDNDTQEILDTFQDGRNLSLIDVKSPILLNIGKNLFNVNDLIKKHNKPSSIEITKTNTGFNMKSKHTGAWHATNYSMQLKPNTQYIFNCVANTKSNTGSIKLWNDCESYHVYRDVFLQNTTNLEINITFTTQKDGVVKFQLNTTRDISALGDIEVLNVSLYELTNQTTYEPYKSNTTTFDQKDGKTIVLRSLPDGTCDTLNVETGEYVQKIGERNYQDGDTNSNTLVTDGTKTHYKLSSPITTKVDVQGFPHAYKNGHIQLSSGSAEPSLTPTVTYKVPVSRVGQIASNTKSNLRQTIKLDQLEVLVYQSLINAEYENLLVQNSAESATSFTNLSTNDPKDELYYMLKHLIEEDQPVQNMLDKINLFYLYGLLNDEHYFDLLLGGEEDVY